MNKYETLFIAKPSLTDDQVEAVVTRLTDRIGRSDGKVAAIDYWGIRRLAYPILYRGERFRRGYYVLLTYAGGGQTVEEVERNIKIIDDTFRYMTVKLADKIDPASIGEATINKRSEPPVETPVPRPAEAAPAASAAPAAPVEAAPAAPAEAAPAAAPESAPAEPAPAAEPAAEPEPKKDEE